MELYASLTTVIHWKTQEEHDTQLQKFLSWESNKGKTETSVSEITFMGRGITVMGFHIDSEKVCVVADLKKPKNEEELCHFLGMINYVVKFLSNLTTELHPLHNFLNKDVSWTWSRSQQTSFNKVKQRVNNTPILVFYDPDKELILENAASEHGLGS